MMTVDSNVRLTAFHSKTSGNDAIDASYSTSSVTSTMEDLKTRMRPNKTSNPMLTRDKPITLPPQMATL